MIGTQCLGEHELGGPLHKSSVPEGLRRYVADLVGTSAKVFYLKRPQSERDMPCIVIDKESEERADCLDTPATCATYGFTISIWSYDPVEADTLYRCVRGGIELFRGYWLGRKVCSVWLVSDTDSAEPPEDAGDDWVYGKQTTYSMIIDD